MFTRISEFKRKSSFLDRFTYIGYSLVIWAACFAGRCALGQSIATLPKTQPLKMTGEIDRQLISGVSRFLDQQLDASVAVRTRSWHTASPNWPDFLSQRRDRLRSVLGMQDPLAQQPAIETIVKLGDAGTVSTCELFDVLSVRWRAFGQVFGEGLLLRPKGRVLAHAVVIPDADQSPEQLVGLAEGIPMDSRVAVLLAANNCQVLIPTIISRKRGQFEWNGRRVDLTNREFLYRPAFEMGRHLVGYEVQKVLAGINALLALQPDLPVSVVGWGEGGSIALFSAALEPRVQTTCVSGYFGPRQRVWQQPVDRNIFGQLNDFGDAELVAMLAGRDLIVEAAKSPNVVLAGGPGAPGKIATPAIQDVRTEYERAVELAGAAKQSAKNWQLVVSGAEGDGPSFCSATMQSLIGKLLQRNTTYAGLAKIKEVTLEDSRTGFEPDQRMRQQMQQIDRHTQRLLVESPYVRAQYMKGLSSKSIEEHSKGLTEYRRRFAEDVVGRFDQELLAMNPRTRLFKETDKWTCYEVVLDVFPDVMAYGLLLLPRDLKPGEKRPVVVCQHGLEGRPQDVIGEESFHYYKGFAAKLAERGFITFAPQNLYRHRDDFRVLQRKANPLGKTLFSMITPQHQQIVNWLKTQPHVDPQRIAFYGLSYGGKTAMRVPALVPDYCLSICSADFNDWVWKNASTRSPYSYVWTGEYEIFEWNLGSTFNYSEMAQLIAPRPFMVERGHFDGVAPDERVALEFAKVRNFYQAKLGIGERCEIEFFVGPHTINGKGTFDFLHRHLDWPKPDS